MKSQNLTTALDVGCGFGFFSGYLNELGFKTRAFDGRAKNVEEAKKRYAKIEFSAGDIEGPSIVSLGPSDLVLCVGVLYHLENPFLAIRNLAALTRKVLVIESMIVPSRSQVAYMFEEPNVENQGLNYVALIPSESWFVKCLYKAGFPYVYRSRTLPDHEEFSTSLMAKRHRTVLVAAKVALNVPILQLISEPTQTSHFLWYRFGIRHLIGCEMVRNTMLSVRRVIRRR
jgi:SAM-dependent methyltransferase